MDEQAISVHKSSVHNLKAVSCTLPHNRFYCLTGVSGSGKSSFAFDTIFVEGQRRYVESLSHQAKRLFSSLPKPDVESITGLTPTISIEQKSISHNPRSTVGTLTEIYDYLRILFARMSIAYCPISLEPVSHRTKDEVLLHAYEQSKGLKIIILAPWAQEKKGSLQDDFEEIQKKGFSRVRVDGKIAKIEEIHDLDAEKVHDLDIIIDRIQISEENRTRTLESFSTALEFGNGMMFLLDTETEEEQLFSIHAFSQKSGKSYAPLEPHDFSFNSPFGMCTECHGLGKKQLFMLDKVLDSSKSIQEDCCSIASSYKTIRYKNIYDNLATLYHFSVDTPFHLLSEQAQHVFLYGTEKKWTRMLFIHPETGATWYDTVQWRGALQEAYQRYQDATSDLFKQKIEKLMTLSVCPSCKGSRLKSYPAAARFFEKKIQEIVGMTIDQSYDFFTNISFTHEQKILAQEVLENIISRLHFLKEVGLGYMTLDRESPTLSGGEAQRVRLASQIGSGLMGVTYVLDEPSIGLHPHDNKKLIDSLLQLRDKGNTVIVVEHDEETMRACDTLIEFGPYAGEYGGEILFCGTVKELQKAPISQTKEYLFNSKAIEENQRSSQRVSSGKIVLKGATQNNLKNTTVEVPLGLFVGVTGLSGSGKSSLFLETLFPALSNQLNNSSLRVGSYSSLEGVDLLEKVIEIDQSPIGRTPRSNPATYSKVFDDIRVLFASLPESKSLGWTPGRFSFNVKEGSCSECSGMGMIRVDMDFLEESWIDCPVCLGDRFDEQTLSVRYKGKHIQDVLDMTCEQALQFFEALPHIKKKLTTLCDVGLNYLKLGQSSTTLSGGEAQRLKLAKELARPDTGNTLYLLDEPTTGLHFKDIQHLIHLLQKLVDRGNSILVIEHNMDLISQCDWVIDIGPGSGDKGGKVIFEGTAHALSKKRTPTGIALFEHRQRQKKQKESRGKSNARSIVKPIESITIQGACQNNLKSLSLTIPRGKITTIIGPSGSGKSSLAFDTIYAEGQRRYVESLSPYARQFVRQMPKPKIHAIQGISPAIAIEQRQHAGNPRSTIGTITEIYDYLRIIWAQLGEAFCPRTGKRIHAVSKESIVEQILSYNPETKIEIFAPLTIKKGKDAYIKEFRSLIQNGFTKVRIKDLLYPLEDLETLPKLDTKRKNEIDLVIDRIKPVTSSKKQILSSLQLAAKMGNNRIGMRIGEGEKRILYNLRFAVEGSDETYPEITPQTFAFNTKQGMCQDCKGLGYQLSIDIHELPISKNATIEDFLSFFIQDSAAITLLLSLLEKFTIYGQERFDTLSSEKKQILLHGSSCEIVLPHSSIKASFEWVGLNKAIESYIKQFSEAPKSFQTDNDDENVSHLFGLEGENLLKKLCCSSCEGSRINPLARNVRIDNLSISALTDMTISDTLSWITKYVKMHTNLPKALLRVFDDITRRLQQLEKIGIGYLSLARSANTLSGGEAQRVRLVSQIGSSLTGITYILDEPTIGLHPDDAQKLIHAFYELQELNNTILVVEHDPDMIRLSDHIIELGPESGQNGGSIVFEGSYSTFLSQNSLTSTAIREEETHRKKIGSKQQSRPLIDKKNALHIQTASINNLKISNLYIPSCSLVALSGVSGSGKSTLLFDVLQAGYKEFSRGIQEATSHFSIEGFDQFQQLIVIDQKPFSHNARSDLATYTDLLTPIRHFFATLPEAQKLGLEAKNFSAYHKKGMCTHCWGLGYKKISMHFMPSVQISCPECKGARLNPISLSVQYKGYSIGSILKLSLLEAFSLFEAHPKIIKIVEALIQLDLGYLLLGQEIATLSSGEAQRVKIARELAKSGRRKILFLMDEPTTGLHLSEVKTLINVLRQFITKKGHSIIAIEHNISFLSNADYIIEIGPGAGSLGGKVVSTGTPSEIIGDTNSRIGPYISQK